MKVPDNANWKGLISAVVLQALSDLQDPDPLVVLDASEWIMGGDFPLWMEAVEMPFVNPVSLFTSGDAVKVGKRVRWRVRHYPAVVEKRAKEYAARVKP